MLNLLPPRKCAITALLARWQTVCDAIYFLNWFRQTVPHTITISQGYIILEEKALLCVDQYLGLYPYVYTDDYMTVSPMEGINLDWEFKIRTDDYA